MDDVEASKVAQDMGLKAKLIKSFYRIMKGKCSLTKCPLVVINHEIENPNELHKSIFKQQGGGNSVEFFSTVMLNVAKKKEKNDSSNEKDKSLEIAKKGTSGQIIRFFTQKNRLAIPHLEIETYLNFISGLDPYSGLKDIAVSLGVMKSGRSYTLIQPDGTEEKIGYYKDWRHDKDFWEKKVFPILEPKINEEFKYRTIQF
jgi:RecA/RadA recombinase